MLGVLLGFLFLLFFLYRRIRWMVLRLSRKPARVPGPMTTLRSLLLIFLWTAVAGMILFAGFFFRAYQTFTREEPVASVQIEPHTLPSTVQVTLIQFGPGQQDVSRRFVVSGDQWVLEGDILKWPTWMNFIGLHTRYRLTRLRGRYIQTEDEKKMPSTIYPLVENEDHPLWRYLYKQGHRLPFVSTVYGNAVFQTANKEDRFLIYVSTSGFIARRETER